MVYVPPPQFPTGGGNFLQQAATAESVRGARIRNQLSANQLALSEEAQANLERVRQMRRTQETGADIVRELRASGHNDAADMFIQQQQEQYLNAQKLVSEAARWVKDATTYENLRSSLIQEGAIEPEDMPVNYDPRWFQAEAGRIKNKLSTFNRDVRVDPQGRRVQQQVIQDASGRVVGQGPEFVSPQDRRESRLARDMRQRREARQRKELAETRPELRPAVSNSINRAVGEALGGTFDIVTGRIQLKDQQSRQRLIQLSELAEDLLKTGEASSINEAVARAFREAGIPIPGAGMPTPNPPIVAPGQRPGRVAPGRARPDDPLGIRNLRQ